MTSKRKSGVSDGSRSAVIPVKGHSRLLIQINKTWYQLRFLAPEKDLADPAWRLTKVGSTSDQWDVALTQHGPVCTCPDWTYRRAHRDGTCKHVGALRSQGLLQGGLFG